MVVVWHGLLRERMLRGFFAARRDRGRRRDAGGGGGPPRGRELLLECQLDLGDRRVKEITILDHFISDLRSLLGAVDTTVYNNKSRIFHT